MSDASPDEAVECHCTGVRRAELLQAIAAGCTTVDELRRRTGAGSGCGSCRPELRALLTARIPQPRSPPR